jgi:hypothetical protein
MIRFPLLIALEAICALTIGAVARDGLKARPSPTLHVVLSAIGEKEAEDGRWAGVELLAREPAPLDRFQLTIRPDQDAQVELYALTPTGTQRIFPLQGHDGRLRADTTYALPGPHGFYELDGPVRLRLTVRRVGSEASPAAPLIEGEQLVRLPLSDGTRFAAEERALRVGEAALLEWTLSH